MIVLSAAAPDLIWAAVIRFNSRFYLRDFIHTG